MVVVASGAMRLMRSRDDLALEGRVGKLVIGEHVSQGVDVETSSRHVLRAREVATLDNEHGLACSRELKGGNRSGKAGPHHYCVKIGIGHLSSPFAHDMFGCSRKGPYSASTSAGRIVLRSPTRP